MECDADSLLVKWDHPREYGENVENLIQDFRQCGSSPRIRGECLWTKRNRMMAVDHPREYGENEAGDAAPPICPGSSPRIRGELGDADTAASKPGIIPANTGRI